jgi:type I restriction enzyme M protein
MNEELKGESQEDAAGLASPDAIAAQIVEDLRAALEEFAALQADLASALQVGAPAVTRCVPRLTICEGPC